MDTSTSQTTQTADKHVISKIRHTSNEKSVAPEGQLSVDIYQNEDSLIILAPIAGCNGNDIDLTVTDEVLCIKGKRVIDIDIDQEDFYTKECFWGNFSRTIVLPTKTDTSKINARFEKGILRVEIPKVETERTRKIDIVEIL